MSCPCGNSIELEACCGRFIRGGEVPATAAELMRSRYTAYALEEIDYVVATHDPKSRDEIDRESAETWARESEWLGLDVLGTEAGGPEDDRGVVEFVARYSVQDNELAHHERSQFRKEDGRWFYVDGEMIKPKPVVREQPKVGRNEPCPCGSGKKFKKCCQ